MAEFCHCQLHHELRTWNWGDGKGGHSEGGYFVRGVMTLAMVVASKVASSG